MVVVLKQDIYHVIAGQSQNLQCCLHVHDSMSATACCRKDASNSRLLIPARYFMSIAICKQLFGPGSYTSNHARTHTTAVQQDSPYSLLLGVLLRL